MLREEAANINFIVFSLSQPGFEPTIYHTIGVHTNHYTTDAVLYNFNTKWIKGLQIHKLNRKLKYFRQCDILFWYKTIKLHVYPFRSNFFYLTLFHVIIVNRFGCVAQFSSSVMVETILSVIIVLVNRTCTPKINQWEHCIY